MVHSARVGQAPTGLNLKASLPRDYRLGATPLTTPTPTRTTHTQPAQQAASAHVEHVSLDSLETVQRANPKNLARQAEYENKLRSLTAGGPAMVFHLGHDDVSAKSGKASSRGLKLRLTYAIKRMGRKDIIVQDAKLKETGELIVAAYIKK